MQIKIQSGVGQKALEFTYKLGDLALRWIMDPMSPGICLCGGSEDPTHGKINNVGPLHMIWVQAVEGKAQRLLASSFDRPGS